MKILRGVSLMFWFLEILVNWILEAFDKCLHCD